MPDRAYLVIYEIIYPHLLGALQGTRRSVGPKPLQRDRYASKFNLPVIFCRSSQECGKKPTGSLVLIYIQTKEGSDGAQQLAI